MANTQNATVQLHRGKEWHCAPDGLPSGNGTMRSPWDINTAVTSPGLVQPGDIVWLHGGTYTSDHGYAPTIGGTNELPIIIRSYPGEWARLDGWHPLEGNTDSTPIWLCNPGDGMAPGNHLWFWDMECFNSCPIRSISTTSSFGVDIPGFRDAFDIFPYSVGCKVINCVIHDCMQGGLLTGFDQEIYGNLVYYNGYDIEATRGSGHGFYMQCERGGKWVVNNMILHGFSYGLHGYSTSALIRGVVYDGNMTSCCGNLSHVSGYTSNILGGSGAAAGTGNALGGLGTSDKTVRCSIITENAIYSGPNLAGAAMQPGYVKGIEWPIVTNNYFSGGFGCTNVPGGTPTITGNKFYGAWSVTQPSPFTNYNMTTAFPSNEYYSSRPTANWIKLRPNKWERGRMNMAIFNWQLLDSVDVDISSSGLLDGETWELRPAQDYFNTPVLTGTYSSGSTTIPVPMTGLTQALPQANWPPPVSAGKEFQIFILRRTGAGVTDYA